MENIFKGCMPALMTPCNQDLSPNFDLLVKKADELMNYGMSAVIYCGSMGDWPLLTDEERQEGVSRLVKAGIPTFVGTGSNIPNIQVGTLIHPDAYVPASSNDLRDQTTFEYSPNYVYPSSNLQDLQVRARCTHENASSGEVSIRLTYV